MTALDIVYMVKPGETNEELRHSLRSLANLPHGRVWLVGYKPRWVRNVGYLPMMQRGPKHHNTWRNWVTIAQSPELPDRFVLFNDDFFVTRPVETIPTLHRGTLDSMIEWLGKARVPAYRQRMEATRRVLRRAGRPEPYYAYEMHAPMVMDRAVHADSVDWLLRNAVAPPESMAKRSFYANWQPLGGEQATDIKVRHGAQGLPESHLPFLSTAPESWAGLAGGWVRRTFAVPSVYEVEPGGTKYQPPTARGVRRGRRPTSRG